MWICFILETMNVFYSRHEVYITSTAIMVYWIHISIGRKTLWSDFIAVCMVISYFMGISPIQLWAAAAVCNYTWSMMNILILPTTRILYNCYKMILLRFHFFVLWCCHNEPLDGIMWLAIHMCIVCGMTNFLSTQGARASATMVLTMVNRVNWSPHVKGFKRGVLTDPWIVFAKSK